MTEQNKMTNVPTRIPAALSTDQTDQIINTTHSEDDSNIITKLVLVPISDQDDSWF